MEEVAGYNLLPYVRLWDCQINLGESSGRPKYGCNLGCCGHDFPFRHRIVAESSKSASGDDMALDVEQIVDGSRDGEESLG